MATRPVYAVQKETGNYGKFDIDFNWEGGMSLASRKVRALNLEEAFNSIGVFADYKVLEVSTASDKELGNKLSAFNLRYKDMYSVEQMYQGSKVFENGGPFSDIYKDNSARPKRDERLTNSGKLIGFRFNGRDYGLTPSTAFYNFLYITVLDSNKDLADEVMKYDAFTDINFNPNKGVSNQAQACAAYVMLRKKGKLEKALTSYEAFVENCYK